MRGAARAWGDWTMRFGHVGERGRLTARMPYGYAQGMLLLIGLTRAAAHAMGTHNIWCRNRYCTQTCTQS